MCHVRVKLVNGPLRGMDSRTKTEESVCVAGCRGAASYPKGVPAPCDRQNFNHLEEIESDNNFWKQDGGIDGDFSMTLGRGDPAPTVIDL
jgi:hypothetical protein